MTMYPENLSSGINVPPLPLMDLTIEQEFRLKQTETQMEFVSKVDLIEIAVALLRHNMVCTNNIANLVKHWPK